MNGTRMAVLAAARQLERNLAQRCRSVLRTIQDALGQRMTHPVGVYVLDLLADAVRTGMDSLSGERVLVQREAVIGANPREARTRHTPVEVWFQDEMRVGQ
jgi:hypothetical protein